MNSRKTTSIVALLLSPAVLVIALLISGFQAGVLAEVPTNDTNTGMLESSGKKDIQSAWRPFSSDSPWNTPLSHDAVNDPRSTELIADFNIDASALGPAGKTIAHALQEYATFLGDFAGGNVLYAETAPAALMAW